MDNNNQEQRRYPGIRSFEEIDAPQFYGRAIESEDLYSLIRVERFAVLFAKSGIGKTSLINAGVVPFLKEDVLYPINVRFQDAQTSPMQMLKRVVEAHVQQHQLTEKVEAHLQKMIGTEREATLWEYLKTCEFEQNDLPAIPVLILDQFEEFFIHTNAAQQDFIDCIADLIYERVPKIVYQDIRKIPRRERTAEHLKWAQPLDWKIIFAIRSDRLSLLDHLSEDIPLILNNRYQLLPLNKENAQAAILHPAQSTAYTFQSPCFEYSEEAIEAIIQNLSNKREEIESFQLQIICQYLESKVIQEQLKKIETSDIGGKKGIQQILNNYYQNQMASIEDNAERVLAQKLIEEGLIIDGARVSLAESIVLKRYGIGAKLLSKLLSTRLIKPENTHLGKAYEVSHDTLVEPILRSLQERQAVEEQERLAKEKEAQQRLLAEQQEKLEAEQKRREELERLLENVKKEQNKAARAMSKNQKIVDAFYFYEGEVALAYNRGLYGFIDKNGNIVIDFRYKKIEPFNEETNYAKAVKDGYTENFYLIDTEDNEYKLAEGLDDLDGTTQALELYAQLMVLAIRQEPIFAPNSDTSKIFDFPQIEILDLRGNQLGRQPKCLDYLVQLPRLKSLNLRGNQLDFLPKSVGDLSNLTYLNLSLNSSLESFPECVTQLSKLEILDFSDSQLEDLSESFGQLQSLRKLNLSDNCLEELPESFGQLQNLAKLKLNSNELQVLPESFGQLRSLKELYLNFNKLQVLPESFGQLSNLRLLEIGFQELSNLPESFGDLANLEELTIEVDKGESSLPESFGELSRLTHLDLRQVDIVSFPESFGHLHNLLDLKLNWKAVQYMPKSVGELQYIKTLDLTDAEFKQESFDWLCHWTQLEALALGSNQFDFLPESFGQLNNLKVLDLTMNWLNTLPEYIGTFKHLTQLHLWGNKLSTLPESLGQLQHLEELYLHRNRFTALPVSIGNLQSLKTLNVANNFTLKSLPDTIGQLQKMEVLNVGGGQLEALPDSIGALDSLTELHLGRNQLSALPESIGALQSLEELQLSENRITSLPETIGNLQDLKILNVYNNELSILPESIGNLQNLEELHLGDNQFKVLPKSFNQLQKLKKLDLGTNQFSTLPDSLKQLGNLKELELRGNPFGSIPESIGDLVELEKMSISLESNKESILPASIGNLRKLTNLNLREIQIADFPESIGQLQNLIELNLDWLAVRSMPKTVAQFRYIKKLDLSGVFYQEEEQILTLDWLGNWTQIITLNLPENKIKQLPESIGQLVNLKNLNLSRNPIEQLPESICDLQDLIFLDVSNTSLKELPQSFVQLKKLETCFLKGLSISNIEEIKKQMEWCVFIL
ncbi:MAG: hypothetical protein GY810_07565 [Aureispira sp.]|nr:hypothetical protein [Aureispira sp.]